MSHTPGKLRVDPKRALRIANEDDETVASTGTTDSLRNTWEANARRLVACWNACDGIDTEYLEGNDSMAHYARRLMLQRADLLEALEMLLCPFEDEHIDAIKAGYGEGTARRIKAARAAISKAKGQS